MEEQKPTTENQNPNNESELLKQEIEKIREDYKGAKQLLRKIEEFGKHFEVLRSLLDSETDGVEFNVQQVKNGFNEIKESKDKTQTLLTEITSNVQKVKANIESMDTAYVQFNEIKGKISGANGEIDTLLNSARSLQKDIERIKTDSQQILDNTRKAFDGVQTEIQNMKTAYQEFLIIKNKIDDEKTGLKAIFDSIQEFFKKSDYLNKEIQSFREESKKFLEDIKSNKNDSDQLKSEIKDNLSETKNNKEEIQKITDIITDTGFANAFQKRAKGLFNGYRVWGAILLCSIILLSILLYILFSGHLDGEIPDIKNTFYRLSLTSPLLLLVGFAMSQYTKERNLNEKYEFKATTSIVVRNHIKFLMDTFEKDERVISFAMETFKSIYKEPYNNIKKYSFQTDKENPEAEAEENDEILNSIKELTSIIPDKENLGKVLDIIATMAKK